MLDADLADLYGVETKRLNEQVRRNIERFPEDFMFQLTSEEFTNLKSQFVTSSLRSQIATSKRACLQLNPLRLVQLLEVELGLHFGQTAGGSRKFFRHCAFFVELSGFGRC